MVYPLGTRCLKTSSGAVDVVHEGWEVRKLVLKEVFPMYGDVTFDKSIAVSHDDPVYVAITKHTCIQFPKYKSTNRIIWEAESGHGPQGDGAGSY